MATSIFRKDSRGERPDEDILSISQFAASVTQQKLATQLSGAIGDLGNKVSATPTMTLETIAPPSQPQGRSDKIIPPPENFLPSEVIQVCYNGRPAEFRMYGGFIRYLDGQ